MTSSSSQKLARDSRKALRQAWPYRHGMRGRIVVRANIAMLRRVRKQQS